jgi:hypothetical protein
MATMSRHRLAPRIRLDRHQIRLRNGRHTLAHVWENLIYIKEHSAIAGDGDFLLDAPVLPIL